MGPPNYFSHVSAAERYAKFRPYFHPVVMERLVEFTGCARFGSALDVGCGTGLSTRALAEISDWVAGVDNSAGMLALAPKLPNVVYQQAAAESLPYPPACFDLVTVCQAFHWFDQDKFLREAHRVLKPRSWLLIYNNVFLGAMRGCPEFKRWMDEVYLKKYLTTPRARKKLTADYADENGFVLAHAENYPNEISLSRGQLAGFFQSQSNVIAFVEQGNENIADVAAWIDQGLAPFFAESPRALQFVSDIWYLQKKR